MISFKKYKKYINNFLFKTNHSTLLAGIAMIILNVGSRYVEFNFSDTQETALKSLLTREILIFAISFTATKDLILSFILTASFIVLSNFLFNENSKLCIVPTYYKNLRKYMDFNKDGIVTPEEEMKAMEILKKVQAQKFNNNLSS